MKKAAGHDSFRSASFFTWHLFQGLIFQLLKVLLDPGSLSRVKLMRPVTGQCDHTQLEGPSPAALIRSMEHGIFVDAASAAVHVILRP